MARKPLIPPGSILPTTQDASPPDDLLSRVIAKDRARHRTDDSPPAEGAPTPSANQEESPTIRNSAKNITGNITKDITEKISGNTSVKIAENKSGNGIIQQAEPDATESLSVAERIRATARGVAKPAPLRVLTLRIPPDLDDQVEAHCFTHGLKKQDVLRDALLLYFETVKAAEEQP